MKVLKMLFKFASYLHAIAKPTESFIQSIKNDSDLTDVKNSFDEHRKEYEDLDNVEVIENEGQN